ncbi:MAG: tetratricopeptide repeat protein [Candidatus Eiseniibacteriota bacterium]
MSAHPSAPTPRESAALFAAALLLRAAAFRPGLPPAPPEAVLLGPEPGPVLLAARVGSLVLGALAVVLTASTAAALGGRLAGLAAGALLAAAPFALSHSGWVGAPGALLLAAAGCLLHLVRYRLDRRARDLAAAAAWSLVGIAGLASAPLTNVAREGVVSPIVEAIVESGRAGGWAALVLAAAGVWLAVREAASPARMVAVATVAMLVIALLREGPDPLSIGIALPGLTVLAGIALARVPMAKRSLVFAVAGIVTLVGSALAITASRAPGPAEAAAEWVRRNVPNGAAILVGEPDLELPAFDLASGAKGFQRLPLPPPGTSGEEADAFLDPEIARRFGWLVLRDPPASARAPQRAFHEFFDAEWETAARFGERAHPASPVTVLRRPEPWKPDSARAAAFASRSARLSALRDTSSAFASWALAAGEAFRAAGDIESAADMLELARGQESGNAEVWFEIGLTRLLEQRFEEAMSALHRAIRIDPGHGPAHYNLGSLLEREGDLSGAETEYRAAIPRLADPTPAHTRLGVVLTLRGSLEEARVELEAVRRLAPGSDAEAVLLEAITLAERR